MHQGKKETSPKTFGYEKCEWERLKTLVFVKGTYSFSFFHLGPELVLNCPSSLVYFLSSFAFVDFMTVEHATSALINPKNHQLNGRNLVVEYASPDAVRRGAPKGKSPDGPIAKDRRNRLPTRPYPSHDFRSNRSVSQPKETSESADAYKFLVTDSDPMNLTSSVKELISSKGDVRQKGPKTRPKPGAALALAKRESAAILPSQGHKIIF